MLRLIKRLEDMATGQVDNIGAQRASDLKSALEPWRNGTIATLRQRAQ